MKSALIALCLLAANVGLDARPLVWQPTAGHTQIPLWPGTPPDLKPMPGPETDPRTDKEIADAPGMAVTNISVPTLTLYSPGANNTGAAVIVYPGGGFQMLAIGLEGTEVCDWLVPIGVSCVVLKYRVPSETYDWHCDCRPHNQAISTQALDDAQRAMGLVRWHAKEWNIDPHKIGVLGFSAGGYLVAESSTLFTKRLYKPIDAADEQSARPDFAVALYPGHLVTDDGKFNPNLPVPANAPPTFLIQAENDPVDDIDNSLLYYKALQKAGVPVEMHLYAKGGHAFGLRHSDLPIAAWPKLVEGWLRSIGMVPR